MKITKSQLKQIIQEELNDVIEGWNPFKKSPEKKAQKAMRGAEASLQQFASYDDDLPSGSEQEYDRIIQTIKELLEVSTDGKFDLVGELRAIADYAEKNSPLEEGMYNYDCDPGFKFYKHPDRPGGHCIEDKDSPGTQTKRQPMSGAGLSGAYQDRKGPRGGY